MAGDGELAATGVNEAAPAHVNRRASFVATRHVLDRMDLPSPHGIVMPPHPKFPPHSGGHTNEREAAISAAAGDGIPVFSNAAVLMAVRDEIILCYTSFLPFARKIANSSHVHNEVRFAVWVKSNSIVIYSIVNFNCI